MEAWHVGMAMPAHRAQMPVIPAALTRTRHPLEDRRLSLAKRGQPMWIRFGPAISMDGISGHGRVRLSEIQTRC